MGGKAGASESDELASTVVVGTIRGGIEENDRGGATPKEISVGWGYYGGGIRAEQDDG